ncbi:MAG: chemotaxis protein CheA [Candidatus Omnitrophica bacterium]|nr:chemotaxis protein CheA [Candidatus Omnitrophota bacterium]
MSLEQYRALFVTESEEHLQNINSGILELEKDPRKVTILNEIFRSVHTLKGMSATMGFESLTRLSHRMEDVLDLLRGGKNAVTSEIVDILFQCMDTLESLLEEIKSEKDLGVNIDANVTQLEAILAHGSGGRPVTPAAPSAVKKQKSAEAAVPISLSAMEMDNLLVAVAYSSASVLMLEVKLSLDCQLKSVRVFMVMNKLAEFGEVIKTNPTVDDLELNRFDRAFYVLVLTKHAPEQVEQAVGKIMEVGSAVVTVISDVRQLCPEAVLAQVTAAPLAAAADGSAGAAKRAEVFQHGNVRKIQSVRVTTTRLDKLMNLVGELVIAKIRLIQVAQAQQNQSLSEILTNIDRLSSELQDEVMQARLIPMSQVFDRFPRMVRDLARSESKQVNFDVTGGEIELDRTVLDEIADPLVHLLRNSVDHGIELPEERRKRNKETIGTIRLQAMRERTHVLIKVSDDGKGIDPRMVRESAVRKGFYSADDIEKMSDRDVLNVIFLPGFSSAKQITDTSGRGVGMDVVRSRIEALGGSVTFESTVGQGSSFFLKLPLTVAIIRAMLIRVGDEVYAAPIANIAETLKIAEKKVRRIEKFEVITLRNEVLPLIRMRQVLSNDGAAVAVEDTISVVVVEGNGGRAGLVVDEVIGQQEVVIKQMSKHLKGIKGFAGATILGDGRVALILDVATLMGQRQ